MTQESSSPTAPHKPLRGARLRVWVAKRCSPRSTMMLMLLGTTASGSLASYLLLHAGVTHFGIRYAFAVLAAYATLVGLIGLWSHYEARRLGRDEPSSGSSGKSSNLLESDSVDLSSGSGGGSGSGSGSGGRFGGGGGRSGGAGASSSFSESGGSPGTPAYQPVASGGGSSGGGGFSLDLDGDEVVVILLVVAAVVVALCAAGYVVWIAPDFLGDTLAATLAGTSMSRRVMRHEPGWLGLVIRRTIWPALALLTMFTVAGFALQAYAPGARTLLGAWEHHLARHEAPAQ